MRDEIGMSIPGVLQLAEHRHRLRFLRKKSVGLVRDEVQSTMRVHWWRVSSLK
jgi:hypothetical protein